MKTSVVVLEFREPRNDGVVAALIEFARGENSRSSDRFLARQNGVRNAQSQAR